MANPACTKKKKNDIDRSLHMTGASKTKRRYSNRQRLPAPPPPPRQTHPDCRSLLAIVVSHPGTQYLLKPTTTKLHLTHTRCIYSCAAVHAPPKCVDTFFFFFAFGARCRHCNLSELKHQSRRNRKKKKKLHRSLRNRCTWCLMYDTRYKKEYSEAYGTPIHGNRWYSRCTQGTSMYAALNTTWCNGRIWYKVLLWMHTLHVVRTSNGKQKKKKSLSERAGRETTLRKYRRTTPLPQTDSPTRPQASPQNTHTHKCARHNMHTTITKNTCSSKSPKKKYVCVLKTPRAVQVTTAP